MPRAARWIAAAVFCFVPGCSCSTSVDEISIDESGPMEELPTPKIDAADWPWWRGPNKNGIADGPAPLRWSENANVVWKAEVPGRGHSSPVVVGGRVFLTTAEEDREIQSVICYDRTNGERRWRTDVHQGGFPRLGHSEATHASTTPACDGERVFAAFVNDDALWLTALDLEGKKLWQTRVGPFKIWHGSGASPAIHGSYVIVAADHADGGYLAAVHRRTGQIRWRKPRPDETSYCSPIVFRVAGKEQLLMSGCEMVASYEPDSGEMLWSVSGTTELTVGTVIAGDELVFASGGYPGAETIAVRGDGSEEVAWRNSTKIYTTSMLLAGGFLYGIEDDGIGHCWHAQSGKRAWRARLGGTFRASPLLADGRIYASRRDGTTIIFKAGGERFQKIGENRLGEAAYATPAICGGRMYLRVVHGAADDRREVLYCIGEPDSKTAAAREST